MYPAKPRPASLPNRAESRRIAMHAPFPPLPEIALELVEDVSPPDEGGFLRLVRRRYRARYPDGTESAPFLYDSIDRAAIDAVVIAAHYVRADQRHVFLRSAVRPPLSERDPARSPTPELDRGAGLWELPAGLVEPSERGREGVRRCAARELHEELGFIVSVDRLVELGPSTYPAPGFVAERHFYFEVEIDPSSRVEPTQDGSALEHAARIEPILLERALEACRLGELEDAKTELALRRLAERYS
jgi:ADP-ribose pyrophosphatase